MERKELSFSIKEFSKEFEKVKANILNLK